MENYNEKENQKKNHIENWYKINNCSNEANLFILCIKQRNVHHNEKCKNLFDTWFKCINQYQIIK